MLEIDVAKLLECLGTLEAVVADRSIMAKLDQNQRKLLVIAAGRLAKPERFEIKKMTKALRKDTRRTKILADREVKASSEIRKVRTFETFRAPKKVEFIGTATEKLLNTPNRCYVCKSEYRKIHFFYDSMCESCAEVNYAKRFQTADLRGRIALITGARVKIGFQAALKLLRAGAEVIVTTRFPNDAVTRYEAEEDFAEWQGRLHIFGLDLRHAPSVEMFAQYVNEHFSGLDFLLNNAAQTVRRPRGFYAHLLPGESSELKTIDGKKLLGHYSNCRQKFALKSGNDQIEGLLNYASSPLNSKHSGLSASALMSQIPLLPDDLTCQSESFPVEAYDADKQQVDQRSSNSWRMRLNEVPTAEMLEIQLINAVAPFILCSKLKSLMLSSPFPQKHIVNVSAMEGKFSRYTKTDKHPHTNMAKAALNMLTQTSAPDYIKDGIHMNAVDTGWVTDEDPLNHATRKRDELDFQPPLDIVDGAARICDPIFSGLNTGEPTWGKFLKDYQPTGW